ncbi:MAG: hypothetical protein H7070_15395 [Saprospiraceae bacterium]|nr:hypothetical protein [Pyrinomonadaceae bacterium]
MEDTGKLNAETLKIQGLIDRYLKGRPSDNNSAVRDLHLDEDSLAAFVEGNLNQREARPMISHLVDCSFCRHITAELVQLDLAFEGTNAVNPIVENHEPSKVSAVLSGLLSRIFGTSDGAVFAHNEKDEEKKEELAKDLEKED